MRLRLFLPILFCVFIAGGRLSAQTAPPGTEVTDAPAATEEHSGQDFTLPTDRSVDVEGRSDAPRVIDSPTNDITEGNREQVSDDMAEIEESDEDTAAGVARLTEQSQFGVYALTKDIEPGQAAHFLTYLPARSERWDSWQVLFSRRGFSNDDLWLDGGKLGAAPSVEGQIAKMPLAGTYTPRLILSGPGGKILVGNTVSVNVRESFWGDYFSHTTGIFANPVWLMVLIGVVAALVGAGSTLAASLITTVQNDRQRRRNAREDEKNRLQDEHKLRQKRLRLHLQKLVLRLKDDVKNGNPEIVSFSDWAAEANDPSWTYLLAEQPAAGIIERAEEAYLHWYHHRKVYADQPHMKQETLVKLDQEIQNIIDLELEGEMTQLHRADRI